MSFSDTGQVAWRDTNHGLDHWRGQLSVGAAFCEWIMTLLVIAFTLTFVSEFQNLTITKPRISNTMKMCDEQCDSNIPRCGTNSVQCRTSHISENHLVTQNLSKNEFFCRHSETTTSFIVDATQIELEEERHVCLTSCEV
jgi:hypothetical protein